MSAPTDAEQLLVSLTELGVGLPFNRHLGVEVVDLGPGRCTTQLPANERLHNHLGGVHAIAELAPVELAGALAASSRLLPLVQEGYVPVVRSLAARYHAAAQGTLTATAALGEEALATARQERADGLRPRAVVPVQVTDEAGTLVAEAELTFAYVAIGADVTADG